MVGPMPQMGHPKQTFQHETRYEDLKRKSIRDGNTLKNEMLVFCIKEHSEIMISHAVTYSNNLSSRTTFYHNYHPHAVTFVRVALLKMMPDCHLLG